MKKNAAFKLCTFLVFLIAITTGCSNKPSQSADIVEAWMENMSNQCVSFPLDFNIRVFVEQHGDWVEVPNRVTYVGERPKVLKPKGDIPSSALVYIRPDISGLTITEPIDSYALVTGNLCDDENYAIEKKIPFLIIP
jgi:hypothetical protein